MVGFENFLRASATHDMKCALDRCQWEKFYPLLIASIFASLEFWR